MRVYKGNHGASLSKDIVYVFFCSISSRKAFLEQDLHIYCVGTTIVASSVEAELTTMIVFRLSPIEPKL